MKLTTLFCCLFLLAHAAVFSQKTNDVYVDKEGIMRWGMTKEEVHGFGVNYTVPFAYAYRVAKELGVAPEKAIDDDVYHFARLGFDVYRVHVWDTEISDTLGNLLDNEHLRLLDYAIKKMKDRGMKVILTPIAYWGNGWPQPDEKTPGFSAKYGKAACLTNPDAIKAQQNYLNQFVNHVNRYTGVAYKSEPDLIAFEISNEPQHGGKPAEVTAFINGMAGSIRKTGCKKPVFYNVSHSIHLAEAYFDANIAGGTFQWYPTGLQSKHEIQGNLLPNVDDYKIPFAVNPKFRKMAKIVYEFDAADVGRSYIYPAMARSFRSAGMQVATHFAYDPTFFAYANTEYDTHYMNLVYTPQKALSLKIASEVFHKIPLYKDFGKFPADTAFGDFRVSYGQDLAEMVTKEKFIYTNHTNTVPPAKELLTHVSGYGNSVLVKYQGTGAYFLDKLENGVWRLEVLPDAIWVKDPFGFNSLKKELAVVNWRSWPMSVDLPDLGKDFDIQPLNAENTASLTANENGFKISPGTYLLKKKGVSTKFTADQKWENITLKEFVAPATTLKTTEVLHEPLAEATSSREIKIAAGIVSAKEPEEVKLWILPHDGKPYALAMTQESGYQYAAKIPAKMVKEGFLKYFITVKDDKAIRTFPSGLETSPGDWDFFDNKPYEVRIVTGQSPVTLFNAATDAGQLLRPYLKNSQLIPVGKAGEAELLINPEITDDYSMRYNFRQKTAGRNTDLAAAKKIVFHGRSLNNKPCSIQVALIGKDGSVFGGLIHVEPVNGAYTLPVNELKKVSFVSLPRPYPGFLPYYADTNPVGSKPDLGNVETLQISIGPGMTTDELKMPHGIAVERVEVVSGEAE